jgi:hypothetical protein
VATAPQGNGAPGGLRGTRFDFPISSVGATGNLLMGAVLARGTSEITNAAIEPEITQLAEMLAAMGAQIEGIGTTHLTIETILQAYGWDKGWALLLNAGGNMGAITERSFGVPEAVVSGQYGIGVVIDFFGLSAIASGQPVDFAYPSLTSVVPASVGIVKGGPNPQEARAFVNYLLSEAGQTVLFAPEIARLPVIPELYAKAPKDYPNPFKRKLGGVEFNDQLSSARRDVVNSLYDHIITYRHKELRDAWKAIYTAEEALAKSKSANAAQGKSLVAEARKLVTQAPINDKRAGEKEVAGAFRSKSGLKAQLETEWENFARGNYAKAKETAEKAAALTR